MGHLNDSFKLSLLNMMHLVQMDQIWHESHTTSNLPFLHPLHNYNLNL